MEKLKKNDIYEVEITGFTSEALGVCHISGHAVFVRGTLPGERWRVRIVKVGTSVSYGRAEELLAASPERTAPDCPVYGRCGGCACRHMSYACELDFKLGKVNDALGRIGGLDVRADGIMGSESVSGYRNKAVYSIGGTTESPTFGFFRTGTHEVVAIDSCPLQSAPANACAREVIAWMRVHAVPPYDVNTGKGAVRHVFVRTSRSGDAVCCVVTAKGFGTATQSLVDTLRSACPGLTGVVLCVNRTRGNTVLAGDFYTLWGSSELTDTLAGSRFEIAPQAFYQVNPPQAERLYARAVELAVPREGMTVFELYCGAGTISLSLAKRAAHVVAAEIVPEAVENAKHNAKVNGVENVEFICADAAEAAERFAASGARPDTVVVDPPRKGMSAAAIEAVTSMSPERVVYVSCDPATLARDCKLFATLGYVAQTASAVDMFPRTSHVETVVLLGRELEKSREHVYLDYEPSKEIDLPGGATYEQIKAYVLEHTGLKVSHLYIAQVKQKHGIIERECYNKPKSEDAKQPQCPPEKEAAIEAALKHFKMI